MHTVTSTFVTSAGWHTDVDPEAHTSQQPHIEHTHEKGMKQKEPLPLKEQYSIIINIRSLLNSILHCA